MELIAFVILDKCVSVNYILVLRLPFLTRKCRVEKTTKQPNNQTRKKKKKKSCHGQPSGVVQACNPGTLKGRGWGIAMSLRPDCSAK